MTNEVTEHSQKDIDYHKAIASQYDRVVVEPRWLSINALFRRLSSHIPRKGKKMLDLGAGTGHMLIRFSNRFDDVTAVDHSEAMLSIARKLVSEKLLSNIEFVVTDAVDFMTRNFERYDFISCVGFLHHLTAVQRGEIFRLARDRLSDDGAFVISEPIEINVPEPYLISLWNRSYRRHPEEYERPVEDPDEAPLRREELIDELKSAGFKQIAEGRGWEIFPRTQSSRFINNAIIQGLQTLYGHSGPVYWTCCGRADV